MWTMELCLNVSQARAWRIEVVAGPPGGMVEWIEEGRGKIQAGLWDAEPLESEAFFEFLSGLHHLFTRITLGTFL